MKILKKFMPIIFTKIQTSIQTETEKLVNWTIVDIHWWSISLCLVTSMGIKRYRKHSRVNIW